jgi:hypothetical protein
MSRIVSPTPNVITITINEVTGEVNMSNTREIAFHRLVAVFSQLLINVAGGIELGSRGAPVPPGLVPPGGLKKGS